MFASSLALSLALEKLICTKSIQKCVYILQSYPAGCSLSNHITKDSIVIQKRLIGKSALTAINRTHQRNLKQVCKYSPT